MQRDAGGIVGRAEPLQRLASAVASSASGRPAVVLVTGDAGIGKTTLVRTAVGIPGDEFLLGWGTCWHGEGAPGFWPWTQALGDLVRAIGPEEAGAVAGADRRTLSVVVRELGSPAVRAEEPEVERVVLFDALGRWLETVARHHHVVVVLDDLQWADVSTLDLLAYVTSSLTGSRLLVVGAYRPTELELASRSRLATLVTHAEHIHLDGLSVEEVEELVVGINGAERARTLASRLHRRTGGHPLFVRELARLPDVESHGHLPDAVTGAVTARLGLLPAETRRALDVGSVLGNRILPDVLGSVLGETPTVITEHLAPAVHAGLVHLVGGDQHTFAHDVFRETLYAGLSAEARARLHGEVGAALEVRRERGASVPASDLARHFAMGAAISGAVKAIRWAREAAAEDRHRSAFIEAAAQLRRARTAVVDAGWEIDVPLLVQLLMDEADSQARGGAPDVARALLAEATAVASDPVLVADIALAVQRLGAKFSAPRDEVIAQLEGARLAVTGCDVARQARVTAALARELHHSVAEDRHRAQPLSEEALELGRRSQDPETLVACLLARHDTSWQPGTGAERAELGREIAKIGAELGDVDRQAEGLLLQANGLLEAGSASFRPVLDRWFGLLERRAEPRDQYMLLTRRACVALLEGDLDRGEVLMRDAATVGERIHEPDTGNVLMSQRVALAHVRCDPGELRSLARDAVAWWTGAPVLAHAVAAGAYAAARDLDATAREVAIVVDAGGWRSEGSYLRSVLVAHLADAASALGDVALCRNLLADTEPLIGSCGVNGAVVAFAGPFAHPAGVLAHALGQPDRAVSLLERSIDTARRLGATAWLGRSQQALEAIRNTGTAVAATAADPQASTVVMRQHGEVWVVSWRGESATLRHVKGLSDLAVLVANRGAEVPALQLAGAAALARSGRMELADPAALRAYRDRLVELDGEIDEARSHADFERLAEIEHQRDQLLAEVRRVTGYGGQPRTSANDPTERARKAVSARIRDAIGRIGTVAPSVGAHLDRCVRTGTRCAYLPQLDADVVRSNVQALARDHPSCPSGPPPR